MPETGQVQEIILDRINQLHQSLHDLREQLNGWVTRVSKLEEWKLNHADTAKEKINQIERNELKLQEHEAQINQVKGAMKALALLGSILIGGLGFLEFYFHWLAK